MDSFMKRALLTLVSMVLFSLPLFAVAADDATTTVDRQVALQGVAAIAADATAIYTNMPWNGGGGPCIGGNGARATGIALRTPAGDPSSIGTVVIDMHDVGIASNYDVRLYSDNGGIWDTVLASFPIMAGPGGGAVAPITFSLAAPYMMPADTVFWVVATVPDEAEVCATGWSSGGSTPSGELTYVDAIQQWVPSNIQRSSTLALEVYGEAGAGATAVMLPVPAMGNMGLLLTILLLALTGALVVRRIF